MVGFDAPELTLDSCVRPLPRPVADLSDVLEFWFGTAAEDEADLNRKLRRWLLPNTGFDGECALLFAATVDAALRGELGAWAGTARGQLALVIVLDQLTRRVLRGKPRMFAGDARAQQLALHAFSDGTFRQMSSTEQLFLALPLMHAEDLEAQRRFLQIVSSLSAQAAASEKRMLVMHLELGRKLFHVLARFRRFPHRNRVLGRRSTPAEAEFLKAWWQLMPPAALEV